jgi:hypothetical protein
MTTIVKGSVLERVSVKDFGAVGDGVTDDTAAVQAAVDYTNSSGNNEIVHFPAGRYLITSQVDIHVGTKLEGDNIDYGGVAGATSFPLQLSDSRGTVIIFNPSTQQSLFKPVLPKGGSSAWSGIGIKGFNIWGNTSLSDYHRTVFGDVSPIVTNSLYAIDFNEVHFSNVENVAISGFVSGIREGDRCQENTFNRVHIERCREAAVIYTASTTGVEPTSSVWNQCIMRTCDLGVDSEAGGSLPNGDSLQIRFLSCYFEDFAKHLAKIPTGAKNWEFKNCYGEGVCQDTTYANRSAFRVGFDGGTPTPSTISVSISGQYAAATASTGIFLDIDDSQGANLFDCHAKRFSTAIQATANTRSNSVILFGFTTLATVTFYSGPLAKIRGYFKRSGIDNASTVVSMETEYVGNPSAITNMLGADIRMGDSGTTIVRPGGDNTCTLGDGARRWSEVFAANGTINTSDERLKDFVAISDTEKRVAGLAKSMLRAFRWKAEGQRGKIHFGVGAQSLASIFEANGLDPMNYSLFSYEKWDSEYDEDGNITLEQGDQWGIRYEELLAFIISAID